MLDDHDIIIDLNGAFTDPSTFTTVDPTRIVDTRSGIGGAPITRIGDGTTLRVPATGRAGLPTTGISAVSINITATTTTAPDTGGYITATGRTDIIIDLNGAFTDGSTSTVG
ncbi:MAG: hypothetical protein ACO35E_10440 [Ilumatobacteraceae bacterium]